MFRFEIHGRHTGNGPSRKSVYLPSAVNTMWIAHCGLMATYWIMVNIGAGTRTRVLTTDGTRPVAERIWTWIGPPEHIPIHIFSDSNPLSVILIMVTVICSWCKRVINIWCGMVLSLIISAESANKTSVPFHKGWWAHNWNRLRIILL